MPRGQAAAPCATAPPSWCRYRTPRSRSSFFPWCCGDARRWQEWRCSCCGRCQERCRSTFRVGHTRETMPLKAAQKPNHQCARRSGCCDIDGEGCGADTEVMAAETMSSMQAPRPGGKAGAHLGPAHPRLCVVVDGPDHYASSR